MQISKPFKPNSPRGLLHMPQLKHFCCHKLWKPARLFTDFLPMITYLKVEREVETYRSQNNVWSFVIFSDFASFFKNDQSAFIPCKGKLESIEKVFCL